LNLGSDFIVWSDNEYKRKILFDTMLHDTAIDLCLKSFGAFFFADIMLKNYLKNKELVIVSDVPFEYNRNIIPTVSWIFDNDLINDSVDICKKILNNWFYDESTR
jgi:hypothetical protein